MITAFESISSVRDRVDLQLALVERRTVSRSAVDLDARMAAIRVAAAADNLVAAPSARAARSN